MTEATAWGRVAKAEQQIHEPAFADELPALLAASRSSLACGLARSYGDVCLNNGGLQIRMHRLDRILEADWEKGIVRLEAGATLDALLSVALPRGWFPPVVPGTKFVTLGGAVANDVHGKNHETAGTIGCHVRAIGLLRSNGERLELAPDRNPELFAATIGGLGLTGLIVWVELQLVRVASAEFTMETIRTRDLDAFFAVAAESRDWPYTVAWVDSLARGKVLGRGHFTRAFPTEHGALTPHRTRNAARVPFNAPEKLLSSPAVRLFNRLYAGPLARPGRRQQHYDSFLFPLDFLKDWNRLYGRAGFFQHQSVVPLKSAPETIGKLLELASASETGSFLAVLKLFGARPSPGVLSFPMEGATLALDFPNRGQATRKLLDRMTELVLDAGGRLYPAKDATMSGDAFRAGFPDWRKLEASRDPALMSDFWRRVTRDAA